MTMTRAWHVHDMCMREKERERARTTLLYMYIYSCRFDLDYNEENFAEKLRAKLSADRAAGSA